MSKSAINFPLGRLSSLPCSRLGLARHHSRHRYNECVTWFAMCLFSSPNIVVDFLRFCCSWRRLLHLNSPSVRQSFNSLPIGMPWGKFFGPRTTLTTRVFFFRTVHSCFSLLPRLHQSLQRAQSLGRWMVAPRLSIAAFIGTRLSHFFSSFFSCLSNLLSNTFMCNRYIHLELVAKDALGLHSLSVYLQSYVDNSSKVFMYSAAHMSTFGTSHLRGSAWYLDCRLGFTPPREEALFSSLSSIALVEAVANLKEAV